MGKMTVTIRRGSKEKDALLNAVAFHRFWRLIEEQGGLTRAAAEALFDLDREYRTSEADWQAFFIETLIDYVVWQQRPMGVVTGAVADWLLTQADRSQTLNAFALLVNVLVEANLVPASLPVRCVSERHVGRVCPRALRATKLEAV